jgi:hypothetical protein
MTNMRFEEKLENQAGYPDLQQNAFLARRRRRRTTPAAAATSNRTAKVTSANENRCRKQGERNAAISTFLCYQSGGRVRFGERTSHLIMSPS